MFNTSESHICSCTYGELDPWFLSQWVILVMATIHYSFIVRVFLPSLKKIPLQPFDPVNHSVMVKNPSFIGVWLSESFSRGYLSFLYRCSSWWIVHSWLKFYFPSVKIIEYFILKPRFTHILFYESVTPFLIMTNYASLWLFKSVILSVISRIRFSVFEPLNHLVNSIFFLNSSVSCAWIRFADACVKNIISLTLWISESFLSWLRFAPHSFS